MENKYNITKKYENLIHLLGYSWFYSSKLWHHRFFRNGSAPFSLILIACGIFHLGCWHINYEGIPTLVERYVNIHLSTNVIGYCDSINFYGIFNDDPRNRWIPGETISLYCCPVKLFKQNKLGLTLLTRYQPFWLSLFCKKIYNHEQR